MAAIFSRPQIVKKKKWKFPPVTWAHNTLQIIQKFMESMYLPIYIPKNQSKSSQSIWGNFSYATDSPPFTKLCSSLALAP